MVKLTRERAGAVAPRFWLKVDKQGGDGCWLWTGAKHRKGYGRISVGGKSDGQISTHRLSWILRFGPIKGRLLVCHRCDNPPCVNPDHLFLGTVSDNAKDAQGKGRLDAQLAKARAACPPNPGAKLTEEQVGEMRALRGQGWTLRSIGEMFGVSDGHVSNVVRGKHWPKPKPAKPTGEAFVRVTVLQARADCVIVKSKSGTQFGVTPKDIEREVKR